MLHIKINPVWIGIICLLLIPLLQHAQGINISGSANIVMDGNAQLVIKDAGFTNNGNFNAGLGTVSFTGNAATTNSHISGSATTTFYNLKLNKSNNGIILNHDIHIANDLNFTSGDSLYLNDNNIDLGSTGNIIGETNSSRITGLTGGYIQRTELLNAPSALNPGNVGLEISSAANLGSTIIRRGHLQQPGHSLQRYFQLIPTNNSGLNASVKFFYLDAELDGINESNLVMYSSVSGNHGWIYRGSDLTDISSNFVSKSGFDSLNFLTLASIGTVLPVHILQFDGKLVEHETLLKWSIAFESNIDHYELERSIDGSHFTCLAKINSSSNTNVTQNFEYTDKYPVNGLNYYRLKILTDKSGAYEYSEMVLVKFNNNDKYYLNIYPNPAHDMIKLIMSSETAQQSVIEIYAINGGKVSTTKVDIRKGMNEIPLDIHLLTNGIYMIRLNGVDSKKIKFLKQ